MASQCSCCPVAIKKGSQRVLRRKKGRWHAAGQQAQGPPLAGLARLARPWLLQHHTRRRGGEACTRREVWHPLRASAGGSAASARRREYWCCPRATEAGERAGWGNLRLGVRSQSAGCNPQVCRARPGGGEGGGAGATHPARGDGSVKQPAVTSEVIVRGHCSGRGDV
eukprot:357859-Chlamydomonas_euryale.AAC.19